MNNSKKLLALLMALAMLVTFAAPTFADGETDPEAPPVEEVETPEEIVEEEFDITFKLSDEIKNISSADFTVVAKGDETKTPITKAKAGTELEILLKDDIYYYYYSLILNGEGIRYDYNNGYYSFKMPNEKAVIEVTTGNGYGSNFISARENFKPEGWVSVTINTDEHSRFRVYSERNRYGSTSNQELFYVNPYHEVDLISGYRTYLGPVQLEIDDLHYLTEDSKVVGIFKEATTKNLKCEKMNNYKVILHKYNEAETVEKEYSPKALYTDVVKFLRANETGEVEGKKFVGWMTKSPYANYSKNPYDEIYALDKKYDKYHFIPKYYFNNESTNNVYKDIELFEVYTTDNVVYSGPKSKIEVDGSEIDTISIYYVDFVEGDEELYLDQNKKYYEFDTSTGKFADHEFAHDTEINKDYFLGYQTERREEKDRREPDRPVFTLVGEPRFDYTDEEEPLLDLTPMVIDIFTLDSEGHIIGGEYVQYKDFASKGITLNYKDGQKLTAEDSDKPIKITYRNNGKEYFLYTGEKLIVPNDGFDKNNITEIKVKDQPQLTYDHDDDDKLQKFDLDSLVVTLTSKSTKAGETDQDVIRDVKFADFEKYGLKLSLKEAEDKDPVEIKKDSDVKLAYDKKKLTVSWKKDDNSDPIAEETDEITVNDKVFRLENTVLINKKIDPDTSYIVGDELDLSKLVLTFTDNNKNTKDFTYEELKAMGFKFELCGEDFKTDEEKLAEAKKTAEEEANQLNNLNEAEKAEFKKAIEAAADEETVKKVKAEAKLKDDFIGAANAKFSGIKDKEGVYTSEYDTANRTVNVTILDKTKGARQISGTGLAANLFDLYKNNKLVKLQIGENRDSDTGEIQVLDLNALAEIAISTKPANQDEDNAVMNIFATIIGSQLLTSVQTEGNNTGTLADFVDQSVDIKAIVLDGDIETEAVFKVNGIDGTPTPEEKLAEAKKAAEEETDKLNNLNEAEKAEFKATIEAATDEEAINKVKVEAKLKDDFIGAANEKFSRIKDKEGVYTSEYNPTNRTVNVTILDKTEGARQISGTGLVANLFDLYKNNKLVKLQIGENRDSQSGEIQVVDLNALAELAKSTKPADQDEDNAIMNQFAVVIGSQLLSSVQKEGNNTGKLADFIDQSVDIKAMVLDGDIETEVIFKVNGIDGTPTPEEPAPAPGKDTEEPTPTEPGDDTEESAPTEPGNDTEEPQPEEPAEPGTGGGSEEETVAPAGQCKPIDQMNALELKDNAKKITITGPAKIKVADEEVDAPDAIKKYKDEIAITVEDKNKVEFAFESASSNKTLPTEVTSLLAENKAVDKDTKVELDNPKITTVEVADGKWTFKGWFVDGKEVTEVTASERITKVVGKWEFEEKAKPTPQPQPGGDDNTGDRPYNPPYYPGYYYDEPYVPHTRDYSKKDDYKPAERKEKNKEEEKEDIFKTLYFYLDKSYYEMEVNGNVNQIPMDVAPTAINQRTMLPIRFVAEAIGATVEWHQDTQSATFTKDGITATITLGSNIIQVSDGRQIVMDAEPTVISERIFVPLTNISQIFGMTNGDLRDGEDNDIEWDQENYRVIITVRENQ